MRSPTISPPVALTSAKTPVSRVLPLKGGREVKHKSQFENNDG
jgi:hypothetical protein